MAHGQGFLTFCRNAGLLREDIVEMELEDMAHELNAMDGAMPDPGTEIPAIEVFPATNAGDAGRISGECLLRKPAGAVFGWF